MRWSVPPVVLLLGIVRPSVLTAQDGARIEVLHADVWEFDQQLVPGAQRLLGDVRFKHADAVMRCDSAYLFEDQHVDAYGHIRIVQGDTLTITGDRLLYDGASRTATLDGAVELSDPGSTLTTDHLLYDLGSRTATYATGGRIVGRTRGDTLTSVHGTYLADPRTFIFSRDVILSHPERHIRSDSLHFFTRTSVVEFLGPTVIDQDGSRITCTHGIYDTRTRRAWFDKHAVVRDGPRELQGDSVVYDAAEGTGRAWGAVQVRDTTSGTLVTGSVGYYDRSTDRSWVTGQAELNMRIGGDTLHLHADTLFATPAEIKDRHRIVARRNARFFKPDLQGACDTLIYSDADSVIHMFHRPVLWNDADQITGDTVRITMKNGHAHRLFVDGGAFLASRVDSAHFDQVTGRKMTGYFLNDELARVVAEGNARTVYYAKETKEGVERLAGVNRAECSSLEVRVANGEVKSVTFLNGPDAVLYPIGKAPQDELLLDGFMWRGDERPSTCADIFLAPEQPTSVGTVTP